MSVEKTVSFSDTKFDQKTSALITNLYNTNTFSDTIIVCEDGNQFKAHKIILSSASPVLQKILIEYSESNPILYFGDIDSETMECILRYIYLGEVLLEEKKLESLMRSAGKLKIYGLHNDEGTQDEKRANLYENVVSLLHIKEDTESHEKQKEEVISNKNIIEDELVSHKDSNEGEDALSKSIKKEPIDQNFTEHCKNNTATNVLKSAKPTNFQCNHCDYKTTAKDYLRKHTNAIHEGVTYPCDKCDYRATQTGSLMQHKQSVHEKIRYACDSCDYQAARQYRLQCHILEKHEGMKYSCNQCDYVATTKGRLNNHKKGIHDGISYSCNQCDFRNVRESELKRHQDMVHLGLRFHCAWEGCDFSSADKSRLKKHNAKEHTISE